MTLKIDMSKAYDRMEWPFILLALTRFGFSTRWINWIRECLSSISYSVLLNGNPYDFFIPSRRLPQEDLLSPFLFVIGMEILFRILDKAREMARLNGIC